MAGNKARITMIEDLVNAIKPLLAGQPPETQGGALAALTSIWLRGFVGRDAERVHHELLEAQFELIRKLLREGIEFEDDDDDDGQPTEQEEWRDYDKDC